MQKKSNTKKDKSLYLGLGGNLGNPLHTLLRAVEALKKEASFHGVKVSRFYQTTPVSDIEQPPFINAVVSLTTSLSAREVLTITQAIERQLGKFPKAKNAPRFIDIDILFFGDEWVQEAGLEIPHPRWQERLFVLRPLLDLTETLTFPESPSRLKTVNLKDFLTHFPNLSHEVVFPLEE